MLPNRRDFIRTAALAGTVCALGGSLLRAAEPVVHVVRRGETLSHLAVRYGVTVGDLKRANGLNGDLIRIGQKLIVPSTVGPAGDYLARVREATRRIPVRAANWDIIVAHHSAIKYGNAATYDREHRRRGMQNGLAYHFVIGNGINSGDGEIEIGPRWTKQLHGGHVRNYSVNLTGIGICMVGNFEQTSPTARQLRAFTQLVDWLRADVLEKRPRFAGHKDIERNICPGRHFPLAEMHRRYD